MEPENLTPQRGPEQAPIQYGRPVEYGPTLPTPEQGIETGAERREQASEISTTTARDGLATMLPTPVAVDPQAATATPAVSDVPMVANDDDLIEKEWVEKAKRIIAETRDDPYKREAAVNQLQRDYLMKRYGRELGAA